MTAYLDEALAVREWRRARRWLLGSGVPLLYVLGTILLPWFVAPGISFSVSGWSGQGALQGQPRWMFLTLALTLVGGAMATAFARVTQLWQAERVGQTLEGWFLARQQPGPLVLTAAATGAALALTVTIPGTLLLVGTAVMSPVGAGETLLTIGVLAVGTALAASLATAAFFVTTVAGERRAAGTKGRRLATAPSSTARSALLALCPVLVLALGLWLRIESVEHGWGRPWEEHPARWLLAVGLLTPAPVILGFANPRWWVFQVLERVDLPVRPEAAALLLLLLYAVAALALLRWSESQYRVLRADPERDRRLAGMEYGDAEDPAGDPEVDPHGRRAGAASPSYWGGFANPVWTRELRTRLRGREAPQFIFFASVTLAVGGFAPLVAAAGQLMDPLQTAAVARDVFFWLSMTLVALIALVGPGLTAEAIGAERARGTLELLLTTPMRAHEILLGKLLGDLSVLALLVSPSLPLYGFCYLFHGASGPQVIGVFIVLAVTALLCAMFGITASALHVRTMPAKWQAYLLSLGFCGLVGGPLWLMAALATPPSGPGAGAAGTVYVSPVLLAICGFVLGSLWGRACERLQYAES